MPLRDEEAAECNVNMWTQIMWMATAKSASLLVREHLELIFVNCDGKWCFSTNSGFKMQIYFCGILAYPEKPVYCGFLSLQILKTRQSKENTFH